MKNLLPKICKAVFLLVVLSVTGIPCWSQTLAMSSQLPEKVKSTVTPKTRQLKEVFKRSEKAI